MALHTKLLLVAGLVPLVAAADSLRLLHRIYSPSAPSSDFFERATLDPRGGALQSAPSFASDLLAFAQTTGDVSDALYQVALAPSSNAEAPWLISSVRACHLSDRAHEHITLHLAHPDAEPYALDYFLSPVPNDAACPSAPAALTAPRNTTVSFSFPILPPLPDLRLPPPVTPEGDPVKPAEEKTFLQKYWIYLVVALIALLLAPGGDEGPGGGR